MSGEWEPHLNRAVYTNARSSPPPYISRHAVERWQERGGHPSISALDAWNIGLPVTISNDNQVKAARLFAPSDVVFLGIRDSAGKLIIKTVKYRKWLRSEGKTVNTDHYAICKTCENEFAKGDNPIGCRWCQDGLHSASILDSYTSEPNVGTWGDD